MTLDTAVPYGFGKSPREYVILRDLIKSVFTYNPDTGDLIRIKTAPSTRAWLGRTVTSKNAYGYYSVRLAGKTYLVSRLAFVFMTNEWPSGLVDHINGDRTDNRWSNLRDCSRAQNNQNLTTMRGHSGFRGVHWDKRFQRWKASIKANGLRYNLGSFASKEDAINARLKASKELHGEFAGKHTAEGQTQ
jgi:hypothetical protein